jgi:hypothetical protein
VDTVALLYCHFSLFLSQKEPYLLYICVRTVEPLLSGLRLTVPQIKFKKLNCAETLLEFLEQESDSNVSDILTLCKLRTSIKLKRSKKTKQHFLMDFFKKDS